MNKTKVFMIIFLLFAGSVFASEIAVAPLAVYDSDGNRIKLQQNPSKDIFNRLEKHWFEGLLHFSLLDESRYGIPLSVVDANKICSVEKKEFVLYGFVKKYKKFRYIVRIKIHISRNYRNILISIAIITYQSCYLACHIA